MYDTILVPTDGSDYARGAAIHGLRLAEAFDATMHLLNVVDLRAVAGPLDIGGVSEELVDQLTREGGDAVEELATLTRERGFERVESDVVQGRPAETIQTYADEHGVDIVTMGTQGRTGLERYVAGSVTERVVRGSERPILTTHGQHGEDTPDYDEILVPTDGSEFAAAAVEHARSIAEQFDARIHVMNVVDVVSASMSPSYTPPMTRIERLQEEGEAATAEIATELRDAGVAVTTDVRKGTPAETLLEYATEHDVDMIAMGTAGRNGLDRYLVGSTTERVIRSADQPVLAVNASEQGSD